MQVTLTLARLDKTSHLSQLHAPPQRHFKVLRPRAWFLALPSLHSPEVRDLTTRHALAQVVLLRDSDRRIAGHDKLDLHQAMQQSAAQAWARATFSVINDDDRMAGYQHACMHLLAALRHAFAYHHTRTAQLLHAPSLLIALAWSLLYRAFVLR